MLRLQDTPGLKFTHTLQGDTCLLTAAIFVNNEAAEVVLAHGADPNIGNVSSKPLVASILCCISQALDSIIVQSLHISMSMFAI